MKRLSCLLALLAASLAWAERSPEEETLWLKGLLKPIPNSVWATVAGNRVTEKYEITKGDTLYDVSNRLFGDPKYWPKIWALNNGSITNPHLIRPGNHIAFSPGSVSMLPSVALEPGTNPAETSDAGEEMEVSSEPLAKAGKKNDAEADQADDEIVTTLARSQEWRKLPPRQRYEYSPPKVSNDVDKYGFDKRSEVVPYKNLGFNVPIIAQTDPVNPLGTIIGGRIPAQGFFTGDIVFIQATDELQVGERYAVLGEPNTIVSQESGRKILTYIVNGTVKIIGVKDQLFIGTVESNAHYLSRGMILTHVPPRFKNVDIIPGPSPLEAVVLLDRSYMSSHSTAQNKLVVIDRGSDDGVRPGMVFRVYQHYDSVTGKKLTDSDYIVNADILVLQTTERGSVAMTIKSLVEIPDLSQAVLLTDVSDVVSTRKLREKSMDNNHASDLDKIDEIDVSGGIGKKESEELRQLEKWKENPSDTGKALKPTVDKNLDADAELDAPVEEPKAPAAPAPEATPPENIPAPSQAPESAPVPEPAPDLGPPPPKSLEAPVDPNAAPAVDIGEPVPESPPPPQSAAPQSAPPTTAPPASDAPTPKGKAPPTTDLDNLLND